MGCCSHFLETTDKKDEDPLYKPEKLHKSVKEDVTVGVYINRNNRVYRPLPVDFEDVRGHIEMPKNLIPPNQPPDILIRSIWTAYNDLSHELFTPLLPVGGVVIFDLYKFTDLFPQMMKGEVASDEGRLDGETGLRHGEDAGIDSIPGPEG